MYLRANKRIKDGKEHRYWSVEESRRLRSGRVVQRRVLYLGEINDSQQAAWRKTLEVFDEAEQRAASLSLFPEDRALPADALDGVQVKLKEMELRRARAYGNYWLGCELWRQLGLSEFWEERLGQGREEVPWAKVLELLVVSRLVAPGSEFRLHRQGFDQSAMGELLGTGFAVAQKDRLYRCLGNRGQTKRLPVFPGTGRGFCGRVTAHGALTSSGLCGRSSACNPAWERAAVRARFRGGAGGLPGPAASGGAAGELVGGGVLSDVQSHSSGGGTASAGGFGPRAEAYARALRRLLESRPCFQRSRMAGAILFLPVGRSTLVGGLALHRTQSGASGAGGEGGGVAVVERGRTLWRGPTRCLPGHGNMAEALVSGKLAKLPGGAGK